MELNKNIQSKKVKGNVANIISMLSYAFYPAFLGVFSFVQITNNPLEKIVMASAIVAGKELFTFIVFVFANGISKVIKMLKQNMRGKFGILSVLAGLLGGPIGFTFFTIGICMIGAAAPGALVLSLSLVVCFSLERIIFKKKLNKIQMLGIFITIIGSFLLIILQESKEGFSNKLLFGLLFSFIGAIAWGAEPVLAYYVMQNNPTKMNSNDFLGIKLFSSTIISFILIFVFSGIFTQNNIGFNTFKKFFLEIDLFWKILVVGTSMVIARYAFFYGINKTGSVISYVIITLQIIFIPIFIMFFNAVGLPSLNGDNFLVYDYKFWLIAIFITIGTILVSVNLKYLYKKIRNFLIIKINKKNK